MARCFVLVATILHPLGASPCLTAPPMDVVLLLDRSQSMTETQWTSSILGSAYKMVETIMASPSHRMSLVVFRNEMETAETTQGVRGRNLR